MTIVSNQHVSIEEIQRPFGCNNGTIVFKLHAHTEDSTVTPDVFLWVLHLARSVAIVEAQWAICDTDPIYTIEDLEEAFIRGNPENAEYVLVTLSLNGRSKVLIDYHDHEFNSKTKPFPSSM